MTNTNENIMEKAQAIAAAVMNEVRTSGTKVDTKEEMYEAVCKYVQMTKEQFEAFYSEVKTCNSTNCNNELTEHELDAVVGGSALDWVKDNAATIGIIVGVAALCVLTFAAAGAGIGALGAGAIKAFAVTGTQCAIALNTTTSGAAIAGAILGAKAGVISVAITGGLVGLDAATQD